MNFGLRYELPNYCSLDFGRLTLNEDRRQQFAANLTGAVVQFFFHKPFSQID
jgi:hypothetical protein